MFHKSCRGLKRCFCIRSTSGRKISGWQRPRRPPLAPPPSPSPFPYDFIPERERHSEDLEEATYFKTRAQLIMSSSKHQVRRNDGPFLLPLIVRPSLSLSLSLIFVFFFAQSNEYPFSHFFSLPPLCNLSGWVNVKPAGWNV